MAEVIVILRSILVCLILTDVYGFQVQLDIDPCRDFHLARDWMYGSVTWQGRDLPQRHCNMSLSYERSGEEDESYMCVIFDHYSHQDCSWSLGFYCEGGKPRVMKCRSESIHDTSTWCCEGKRRIYVSLTTMGKDLYGQDNGFILRVERMGFLGLDSYSLYLKMTVGISCSVAILLIICASIALCIYRRKLKSQARANNGGPPSSYTWSTSQPEVVRSPVIVAPPSYAEHQSLSYDPPSYSEAVANPALPTDKNDTDPS